ncbi:PAS domain S-box protein [Halosimplex marinum]|uniref:PAS domain S-box protein n=1 Tax=Halosimplex marinum TaxID=3396620 RepID=UPI003F55778D
MAGGSGGIRVLCVDDDEGFCSLSTAMLEQADERIAAEGVTGPVAALDRFDTGDGYECLVSDYDMPGMDGLELFERVREIDSRVPFILHTGKGSEEIASEAISTGVTDYLQKAGESEHFELLANRIVEYAERYRADREHALTEQRYRRLVEQSVVGIGLSQDGVFEYVNPAFAEMFGYEPDEMVGEPTLAFIDESDRERVRQAIERREAGDVESVHYVVTARGSDGARFDIEVSGSRVVHEGEPAVLGVVRRVDARRRATAALGDDAVTELAELLASARDALGEKGTAPEGTDLAAARDAVTTALDRVDTDRRDSGTEHGTDLGERCRAVWDRSGPEAATLAVASSRKVAANEAVVDRLFSELWSAWADAGGRFGVTLAADDEGFTLSVEPADDAAALEPPPEPPILSHTAESLGWDVFIAETDRGGVDYSFRGVRDTD